MRRKERVVFDLNALIWIVILTMSFFSVAIAVRAASNYLLKKSERESEKRRQNKEPINNKR